MKDQWLQRVLYSHNSHPHPDLGKCGSRKGSSRKQSKTIKSKLLQNFLKAQKIDLVVGGEGDGEIEVCMNIIRKLEKVAPVVSAIERDDDDLRVISVYENLLNRFKMVIDDAGMRKNLRDAKHRTRVVKINTVYHLLKHFFGKSTKEPSNDPFEQAYIMALGIKGLLTSFLQEFGVPFEEMKIN